MMQFTALLTRLSGIAVGTLTTPGYEEIVVCTYLKHNEFQLRFHLRRGRRPMANPAEQIYMRWINEKLNDLQSKIEPAATRAGAEFPLQISHGGSFGGSGKGGITAAPLRCFCFELSESSARTSRAKYPPYRPRI